MYGLSCDSAPVPRQARTDPGMRNCFFPIGQRFGRQGVGRRPLSRLVLVDGAGRREGNHVWSRRREGLQRCGASCAVMER